MIPSNAKVSGVKGDPPRIHFDNHDAHPPRESFPPIPYSAKDLIGMPAQVAYQAINLAETAYMNEHYAMIVAANLTLDEPGVFGEAVTCVGVANEVAEWEFFSTACCGSAATIYTDLEGNVITTPD